MSEFKLIFPKDLTPEEKMLQAKYDTLRKLKQKLRQQSTHSNPQGSHDGSTEASSQFHLKKAACKVLEASDEVMRKESSKVKKTSGFKRSTKQNEGHQAVQKKNVLSEFAPETGFHPRSVTIRGANLTRKLLLETFGKFGEIVKISLGCDNESAVVTYKSHEHARMASVEKHQILAKEGTELMVELVKQRNSSWVDIAEKEAIKCEASIQGINTVHVSYEGKLTIHDFRCIFRSVGRIEKIYISSLHTLSPKKQFAFVTFQFESEAERAVDEVNGKVYNGVTLNVSLHKKTLKDNSFSTDTIHGVDARELIAHDYLET